MFCSKCGVQNPDDAMFCTQCGSPLNSTERLRSEPNGDSQTAAEPSQPEPGIQPQSAQLPHDRPARTAPQSATSLPHQPYWSQQPQTDSDPQPGPQDTAEQQEHSYGESQQPREDNLEAQAVPQGSTAPKPKHPYGYPMPPEYGEKKTKNGLVIGIFVAAIAIVAVVAALFFTGVIDLGDGDGSGGSSNVAESETVTDSSGEDPSGSTAESASSIASIGLYQQDFASIQTALEDAGMGLVNSYAFSSDALFDNDEWLYVNFAGVSDQDLGSLEAGTEIYISLTIEPGGTQTFEYDSDGYAEDPISSLDQLSDDCSLSNVSITYYLDADFDKGIYVSTMKGIADALGLTGADYISATDDELYSAACTTFGIDEDAGYVYEYDSFDSISISGSGWWMDITGYSNETLISISYG